MRKKYEFIGIYTIDKERESNSKRLKIESDDKDYIFEIYHKYVDRFEKISMSKEIKSIKIDFDLYERRNTYGEHLIDSTLRYRYND